MYTARAEKYKDSHHPIFTKWVLETQLRPQPGEHILDLACGTGLVSIPAAAAVGPSGSVIGIDVSDGMLAVAEKKLQSSTDKLGNVRFINHSIDDLDTCPALQGKAGFFDAITCVSALVLLAEPWWALRSWRKYLNPGGRLITDVTHIKNLPITLAMEMTYRQLGMSSPQFRIWAQNEKSFKEVVESAGYKVEAIEFRHSTGADKKVWKIEDAEKAWTSLEKQEAARPLYTGSEQQVQKRKDVYAEMWCKLADQNGNIEEVDGVYVVKAFEPPSDTPSSRPAVVTGSCACGTITWSSTSRPGEVSFCHCKKCQKVSGSAFLACAMMNIGDVYITSQNNEDEPPQDALKYVWLNVNARRGFCSKCGSTISMQYAADPSVLWMAVGSIDDVSIEGGKGWKAWDDVQRRHIFVDEKAEWYALPDDGATRSEKMGGIDRLLPFK